MFYASKNYKIVCIDTCYHVRNIKPENLLTYKTLNDAILDDCRPCKHCLKDVDCYDAGEETYKEHLDIYC